MNIRRLSTFIVMLNIAFTVVASAQTVDFSDKLSSLKSLMDQCETQNIPTDYEMVTYSTIEKFERYINEDIENGETYVDYNINCIETMYNEAKANLEGYLSGTIQPKEINRADMTSVTTRGAGLYNGIRPITSIGYGHFKPAANALTDFHKFGANNIQIEIGPSICNNANIQFVLKTLDDAEKSNAGVTLLLSPHYFPSGLSEDIYADTGKFIKYNINAPEAREVIENYLRTLIPQLKNKSSLLSLCISNEPEFDTRNFPDFYNPLFREYLENVHGSIENLNEKYNSSYMDFTEISMPSEDSATPVMYDWIEFNDRNFADWHKWMAEIIREYLPDVPLHSKVMMHFTEWMEGYDLITRGTDIEMFGEFCDWSGNDTWDWYDDVARYYTSMFYYDYQHSAVKKPVYNSEDHIIKDESLGFDDNQRVHARNNMWMGAIHGRNMSSIWVWDRYDAARPNDTQDFHNSVLYRPDVLAEIGKTSLDLTRLSYQVNRLQQAAPEYALFYSKPSRVYDTLYSQRLYSAYKECLNVGVKPGIISDRSIEQLSEYKTLIISGAIYCKPETLESVKTFIENGGEVIYYGDVFSRDEYGNKLDNSVITRDGNKYNNIWSTCTSYIKPRVTLKNENGSTLSNLDWTYNIAGSSLLINITNLQYDNEKTVSVYLDGNKITGLNELISGQTGLDTVKLSGYTPVLLEYKIPDNNDAKIDHLKSEGLKLTWQGTGADIYVLKNSGNASFVGSTKGNEYICADYGTYIVKSLLSDEKKIITISEEIPYEIILKNFRCTGRDFATEIELENLTSRCISGKVYINVYDKGGNLIKYTYNQITTKGSGKDGFKVSMPIGKDAARIEIGIWDSEETKNNYSNVISKEIH